MVCGDPDSLRSFTALQRMRSNARLSNHEIHEKNQNRMQRHVASAFSRLCGENLFKIGSRADGVGETEHVAIEGMSFLGKAT